MISVVSAEYVEGYTVLFRFNDGKTGKVDLSDTLWGPMFEPLKDINEFKRFSVSSLFDTICWENGADISPEYLYERAEP
jgi:hypothetical protein